MSLSASMSLRDYERRALADAVTEVIDAIRRRGDDALRELALRAHGEVPETLRLSPDEVKHCLAVTPDSSLDDMRLRQRQARAVAQVQRGAVRDVEVESLPGVRQGFRHAPLPSAAYVGDGRVGPVHAGIVTATVAGVPRVVGCAPPQDGRMDARLVAAMALAGATEIYAVGGVHALAALALGTESVPRVDTVVGPGTPAMAEAKRQLFGERGIDLAVGPTELLVIADDTADPEIVGADVLACLASGPDARAVVITTSVRVAALVPAEVVRGLDGLPESEDARIAWMRNGLVHLVDDVGTACELADRYAFERVELLTADPRELLGRLHNCGAVFLGSATTGAMADEALVGRIGQHGEGVWIGRFLRTVVYQECCLSSDAARRMSELSERESRRDGLAGQARSCDLRYQRAAEALVAPGRR